MTWVSLEGAREYAKWAGKRLPHEWEWQYAAQGNNGRMFPWGNCDWLAFGVMDMVGNVWQWTDEYLDDHTAGAILRGGSHYQPQGSIWYFPQACKNDQHANFS